MAGFLDELEQGTNAALTENGAASNRSTLSPVLDFFSRAGAMRDDQAGAVQLFVKAYATNPTMALKTLFYLRDVRGGQGERDLYRAIFIWLIEHEPETAQKVLELAAEYGRWEDAIIIDGPVDCVPIIKARLEKDVNAMREGKSVSLLAKWLPSERTSSKSARQAALKLMDRLELKPRAYRNLVVGLRTHIGLLEQRMSANQWGEIDYEKLPGQALRKHVKAFHRHDEERFTAYIEGAAKGEKKLKAGTLFTYEVYEALQAGHKPALVIADVSGSMYGRPMAVSVSLALYFAQRNQGAFHGYFMTFSSRPKLQKITAKSLAGGFQQIDSSDWGMSMNVEAAFAAVLKAAMAAEAKQEDIPAVLYIISDMEFDACVEGASETNFNKAKKAFESAGYQLPTIVFWNVNARANQSPATKFDGNVTLISGLSASTFRYAVEGKSPVESMLDILNSPRYTPVENALKSLAV